MERFIYCASYKSSEGNLVIGSQYTALIDCGMLFCAEDTINRVKAELNGRPLDYVFATHAHYDHIGALPAFRKEWPGLKLVASLASAAIMTRDTPRRFYRQFAVAAAEQYGVDCNTDYDDDAFQANIIISNMEKISLGDITVEAIDTPGHTRDSICYIIPELEILALNETPGVLMPDGSMYPCYLTSYGDTIASIDRCREVKYKYLSLPHRGIVDEEISLRFFDKAIECNDECRDFILELSKRGHGEEEIFELFKEKYYKGSLLEYQPPEAFVVNSKAAIACTLESKKTS